MKITPREVKVEERYELVFDNGNHDGYAFDCSSDGVPDLTPTLKKIYEFCLTHPEKFVRFNKVVKYEHTYIQNAFGVCGCGKTVELYNQDMGACSCPKCGQWYNLSGQELNPPEMWEEDF